MTPHRSNEDEASLSRHAHGGVHDPVEGAVGQDPAGGDEGLGAESDGVAGAGLAGTHSLADGVGDDLGRRLALADRLRAHRARDGLDLRGVGAAFCGLLEVVGAMPAHSVRMPPGSMTTTSMPKGLSSIRRASLSASTAYLVAWYQPPSGVVNRPPMEETLTTVPDPWLRMCGSASWTSRPRPKRLTST